MIDIKCHHYWINQVSDSAHYQTCAHCDLSRVRDDIKGFIYFTDDEFDIDPETREKQ